jgi:hypothetical protein
MSCQTFNNFLSFVSHSLQLKAFNHIMFDFMTTKLIIYGVIDLKFSCNVYVMCFFFHFFFHGCLMIDYERFKKLFQLLKVKLFFGNTRLTHGDGGWQR